MSLSTFVNCAPLAQNILVFTRLPDHRFTRLSSQLPTAFCLPPIAFWPVTNSQDADFKTVREILSHRLFNPARPMAVLPSAYCLPLSAFCLPLSAFHRALRTC